MPVFHSWDQFSSWLNSRGMFHMELGLGRMRSAISIFGLENPPFPIIQVLGTNGKGSTCSFLSALASAHGLSYGLFTSPHFISPLERIIMNGSMPDEQLCLQVAGEITALAPDLTYFEFLTVLAMRLFAMARPEIAIFEAGLGGRNDATSILKPEIQCFTPIAMDHADIIGPAIADITEDKAAAIKKGSRIFSAPQFPIARAILAKRAREMNAPIEFVASQLHSCGLRGPHQQANASLALAAWRSFASDHGITSTCELEATALKKAFLPGRLQHVSTPDGTLILDGAHNPHGTLALCAAMHEGKQPPALVWSALADKNWRDSAALLASHLPETKFFIPALHNSRAADATTLAAYVNRLRPGAATAFCGKNSLSAAMAQAFEHGRPVLATGSLYLLAEIFTLYPEYMSYPK